MLKRFHFQHHTQGPRNRTGRALPLGVVAAGAIGLFGSGVDLGTGDCGSSGIFGTCQSKRKAAAISRMFAMSQSINKNVYHLKNATDQKFFIVSKELQAIRDIQQHMQDIQNANWRTISNHRTFSDLTYMRCVIVTSFCTFANKLISTLTLCSLF